MRYLAKADNSIEISLKRYLDCFLWQDDRQKHWKHKWKETYIFLYRERFSSHQFIQFSSVAQSCPTLCDPMNCSTPGLPVHHQLPEFTQTHVHRVCDAIQPSHPLSSPSPPDPNPSQHQSLFQWINSAWGGQSTEVSALASFLPRNPRADLFQNGLVGSPCSPIS